MAGNSSWMQIVMQARFHVAALGEAASPAWWRSDATTATSLRLLERLYPRTFPVASLETASRAAASEHDAHIGATGVYQLFRLPIGDETALHEYVMSAAGRDQIQALAALPNQEQLAQLLELARAERSTGARGPIAVGSIAELRSGSGALRRMCAAYAAGFAEQQPVYPYLVKADAL